MDFPWQVIKDLELHNSRLNKEDIIRVQAEAGNTEFFLGCKLALDAMVTFGVKAVSEKEKDEGQGLSWTSFLQLADALMLRQLTGNDAQTAIAHARMKATKEQWNYWYRRILIKDLRCGVSDKTLNKVVEKNYADYVVPVFTCQLAHDSTNHESKVAGEKLIEVKLDGVRVVAIVYPTGVVNLFSRNGKQLANFPLVEQQLARHAFMFAEPVVFDGEIMSASFQDLMKQVHRKSDVQSTDARLMLFDILPVSEFQAGKSTLGQKRRSALLRSMKPQFDKIGSIDIIPQIEVDLDSLVGDLEFKQYNKDAIEAGFEGIMIKNVDAKYECKRTVSWLKMKPFIEVSLTVVAVEEGTGKNEGRLGAIICEGEDDGKQIRVNVGSGFTDDDRNEFWTDKETVVGQIVEVRADAATRSQDSEDIYSLRFPRFLRFRGFAKGEKI